MRIAMVSPYSLSRPGGVQGQVLGLSRALRDLGNEVTVIAPGDSRTGDSRTGDSRTNGADFVVGRASGVRANGSVAPIAVSPMSAVRCARFVRSGNFDVVHVHEPLAPVSNYGCLLGSRTPMLGTFHRSGHGSWSGLARPFAGWLANRLDLRCAVSDAARETAEAIAGGHYEVLFNGVEIDRFTGAAPCPTDRPTVLFLGRHEKRKGLSILLEAFAQAPDDAVLWIGSDGPDTETLKSRYPPSERVVWLGSLSAEEAASRFAGAHVFCAPSLSGESFGVVLLEAFASGCAVVASDLPGYRAASAGHARLVRPGDVEALRAALDETLADPAVSRPDATNQDRQEAMAHARSCSMEALAHRYLVEYERMSANPKPQNHREHR